MVCEVGNFLDFMVVEIVIKVSIMFFVKENIFLVYFFLIGVGLFFFEVYDFNIVIGKYFFLVF